MAARKSSGISSTLFVVLGGIAILLFTGFRKAEEYAMRSFSVKDIGARIDKWLIDGVLLKLTMNIQNESGVPIPIDSFQGVIKYGNTILAPVSLTNPTTILSGQTTTIPFTVPVSYAGLATNLASMIKSKNFINSLQIQGVVTAGGVNVPFTKNIISLG